MKWKFNSKNKNLLKGAIALGILLIVLVWGFWWKGSGPDTGNDPGNTAAHENNSQCETSFACGKDDGTLPVESAGGSVTSDAPDPETETEPEVLERTDGQSESPYRLPMRHQGTYPEPQPDSDPSEDVAPGDLTQ